MKKTDCFLISDPDFWIDKNFESSPTTRVLPNQKGHYIRHPDSETLLLFPVHVFSHDTLEKVFWRFYTAVVRLDLQLVGFGLSWYNL